MELPKYTKAQQSAISLRGSNLLVSAAAGSGKTAVLVERIIQIILDEKKPVDIDRLLVVTFTEAAAAEMRQRISAAIGTKLEQESFNEHLRKQSVLISKAPISTIHAFCNSVVRKNFHFLGIDPAYKIGDATEMSLLREEIINDLFLDEYDKEDNEVFFDSIEIFSDRFSDEKLKTLVQRIYEFSGTSPDPDKWLMDYREKFNIPADCPIENTLWGELIMNSINSKLEGALFSASEGLKYCHESGGPAKYIENILDDMSIINLLIKCLDIGLESFHNQISDVKFSRLASIYAKDNVDDRLKNTVKNMRDKEIKGVVKDIGDQYFFKSPVNMVEDIVCLYPYLVKLTDLVMDFRRRFAQTKLEKNLLDFNDLEHFCLKILTEHPETAKFLSDKFDEVYVDEYQDSNMVQELILSKVSRENNRFMVGDVKQSIYKFRRANPEIFMEKYESYLDTGINIKIDLSMNFRSREGVINGINFIFSQLMTRDTGGVTYAVNEQLNYGADYPENENAFSNEVELLIAENLNEEEGSSEFEDIEDITKEELEATLIAKRIEGIVSGQTPSQVYDRHIGGYRNAGYGDIVILLRSMSGAGTIAQTLGKFDIPCFANTSSGFFQNIEVMTVLSLLNIIDNPHQDIHLLGVLHSPMYGITADGLYEIRKAGMKTDYYTALTTYVTDEYADSNIVDKEAVISARKFLQDLEKWRIAKTYLSVSALISKLYDETIYFDYLGAMPQGSMRQANLQALFEHAVKFEKTSLRGLFRFVKYIEKLIERDEQIKDAQIMAENEGVVRIMTIHKSKGLEFPICFVSSLGKLFNKMDERSEIILHQDYGFGLQYTNLDLRIKSDTIARCALSEQIHMENYSEEIRVLYVALTRAKEKLILTGCVKDISKSFEKWARFANFYELKLPSHYIYSCDTALDWIGAAVLRHVDANDIAPDINNGEGLDEIYNHGSKWNIEFFTKSQIQGFEFITPEKHYGTGYADDKQKAMSDKKIYDLINGKFSWVYKNIEAMRMPSKITVSEIKRNFYSQKRFESGGEDTVGYLKPTFSVPNFMADTKAITAAEKGTAIHTLIEHLDINNHINVSQIETLCNTLVVKNLMSSEQRQSIPMDKILKFVESPLAQRMRQSPFIKREAPFVMEIDSEEAYYASDRKGKVIVHGIIDCFFEEKGKLILIDFKSDRVNSNEAEILKRYEIQLNIYKKALERSMNMEVVECLLYLFDTGEAINFEPNISAKP